MKNQRLLDRIQKRLKEIGMSEREASLAAGLGTEAIRLIKRDHSQKVDRLKKLARAIRVPEEYLTEVIEAETDDKLRDIQIEHVFVRGDVQAGAWREAIEWDGENWYALTVPTDERYPGIERFGLEVRGPSMNLLYPEGTVVICVRYGDIARLPKHGERVICLRRDRHGSFEATVKEYQVDTQGRHVLWPRSTEPEFQQPFVLPDNTVAVGGYEDLPSVARAGDMGHDAGEADLIISALVIQSVRRE
jgi:SOS-response transcriptional repressor LexA